MICGILYNLYRNCAWVSYQRLFFTVDLDIFAFIPGQNIYSSRDEALNSISTQIDIDPIVKDIVFLGYLIVKNGATDLSDENVAIFVDAGIFGDKTEQKSSIYPRISSSLEIVDGLYNKRQEITFVEDTGTIYAEIEAVGGGDIVFDFGSLKYN